MSAAAAERAAAAEKAVVDRHLRRLWALPGTRLGVVGRPASVPQRLFWRWHYWWQAHLLDCLVDAELRAPDTGRRARISALVRGHRLRNGWRWGNNYYDDIAWWALALLRADAHSGLRLSGPALRLARRLNAAWSDEAGGGIPWRRGDVFRNTPANGPAAILLARTGNPQRATQTADWIEAHLRIVGSDLIADGLRPGTGGVAVAVDETVYTYCQGVVLGAELELVTGVGRDASRIHRLVAAVQAQLAPDGVLIGHGGGNGGLFTGILARYLAQVATRLPGDEAADQLARRTAAALVRSSAEAAWSGAATDPHGSPVFSADWAKPARLPGRGMDPLVHGNAEVRSSSDPERDLSVQLSGWMLLEAAALIDR